jgi:nucleolar protein 53
VHKDVVNEGGDAVYDPWAEDQPVEEPAYSFLEEKKPTREPHTLKRASISAAKSGKVISAVRKPDRGKSYNPLFEDWQALIVREGNKVTAEELQRLEDERREEEKQALIAKAQAEEDRDHWESEWESEWEGIMSEKEDSSEQQAWLKKKRPERKTPAERNKVTRRKMEERRKVHEEKMRTRERDVAQIKALAKEADGRRKKQLEQVSAFPDSDGSSSEGEEFELRRGRLGRAAVPDALLEVVLPDELEDSLRRLKPEGNLLQDRFRSMILRGKIESRTKITQPKKPKREVTEKWGYKDWKLK